MANHLTQWKPFISVNNDDIVFDNYATLKRNLKRFILKSDSGKVRVIRSRRGDWGEWIEYWVLNDKGKPVIEKEFWN